MVLFFHTVVPSSTNMHSIDPVAGEQSGKMDYVCVHHLQLNVIICTIGFIGLNPRGILVMTQSVKQMEVQTLLCVLHGTKIHITGQQNIASCPLPYF